MKLNTPVKVVAMFFEILLVAAVILLAIKYNQLSKKASNKTPTAAPSGDVIVITPESGQPVSSPLHIIGKAPGSWFFEAVFPIKILDQDGNILGTTHAQAQGDWQTASLVDFTADLTFNQPTGKQGTLVFENDNPSGLPQNQKTYSLPVTFSTVMSKNPPGTCSPNLIACAGDPEKCMADNANAVCN